MNPKDLSHLRKRLQQELQRLKNSGDCNFNGLANSENNLPDLIDRASSFIDRRLSQNICNRDSLRIRRIEQALEDMAAGIYGIFENCGEDIAIRRLKANSEARQCIRCKTEMETKEWLSGG